MRKKKRLMQVDIIKGGKKITYHIDPTVNLTVYEDGSIFLNEMETVEQSGEFLRNFPPPGMVKSLSAGDCDLNFRDDVVKDDTID